MSDDTNAGVKFTAMVVDMSRGLDGILAMPPNERDYLIVALALSQPRSGSFKAHEWKKIERLADDIANRGLSDVLCGKELSVEWMALLRGWVNMPSRNRGRPKSNVAFRALVQSCVNACHRALSRVVDR